jgi:tetratricopeptide (TPR) repeat protein
VKPADWAHRARAVALLALKKPSEALRSAEDALRAVPASAPAFHAKALALLDLGKPREALDAYERALAEDPDNSEYWHNKAIILIQHLGEKEPAMRAMLRSLQLVLAKDPQDANAWTTLGTLYVDMGKPDEALASYDKAITAEPGFANAHFNKGNLLSRQNRLDKAAESYRAAVGYDENHVGAWFSLYVVHHRSRQWEAALDALERFAKLQPENPAGPLARAEVLEQCGRGEDAKRVLERALEAGMNDPRIQEKLAWHCLDSDPGRAVELARQVVRANSRAVRVLGAALVRNGDWKEGLRYLKESMAAGQAGAVSDWLFAAIALRHLDKRDQARKLYDKSVKWIEANAPDNEALVALRDEVRKLLEES